MIKRIGFILFSLLLYTTLIAPTIHASWIGDKIGEFNQSNPTDPGLSTNRDSYTGANNTYDGAGRALSATGDAWIKLSTNPYFETFGERASLRSLNEGASETIYGTFKLVFTPLGSQWLGQRSPQVKMGAVSYVTFKAMYTNTYHSGIKGYRLYYNKENKIVYTSNDNVNPLVDGDYTHTSVYEGEPYPPKGEQERIKEELFRLFSSDKYN